MFGLRKNVSLGAPKRLSPWRKIAIGTWPKIGDPTIYATIEIPADPILEYIERLRIKSVQKITLTHVIGKVIAEVIKLHPEINCILRFGKLYPRNSIDVFFQVASDTQGVDLSGTTLRNVDQKSILEIAREMQDRISAIRSKRDTSFSKMKNLFKLVPGFLSSPLLNLSGYLLYTMNLWSPLLGVPRDSFGSVMITNIGSLGLRNAFAPLVPYSRVPLLIAIGAVRDAPIIKNGAIVAGKVFDLSATLDHRVIDGVHAGYMNKTLREILESPIQYFGEP